MFIIVLGLALLLKPSLFWPLQPTAHRRRLLELRAGEPEAYFEERRTLEAYPPTHRGLVVRRLMGLALVVTGAALLFLA